jgi:hypothetical protein
VCPHVMQKLEALKVIINREQREARPPPRTVSLTLAQVVQRVRLVGVGKGVLRGVEPGCELVGLRGTRCSGLLLGVCEEEGVLEA